MILGQVIFYISLWHILLFTILAHTYKLLTMYLHNNNNINNSLFTLITNIKQ